MPQKTIVIFGSSAVKENSRAWNLAFRTGRALAEAHFTVANGGYEGTMSASAKGAKSALGRTIGVTTNAFRSPKNEFIDRENRFPTWQERLFRLVDTGDGFIVLDGGTGTLTELAVVWEMLNKKFLSKPVVILGKWMKKAVRALRKNPEIKISREIYFAETPESAVQYLTGKLS